MAEITLRKYHGLGNDYLIYDPNRNACELQERQVEALCRRNLGVGADGILYGPFFDGDKMRVRIFNPDGSEAEKSGNGIRIFSKYLKDMGYVTEESYVLHTKAGETRVTFLNEQGDLMRVDMGYPEFVAKEIPVVGFEGEIVNEAIFFCDNFYNATCVSLGNPNCVLMLEEVSRKKAMQLGPYVENSRYFPNRINMQLCQVLDRENIQIEIYERGAGYTYASGTGACAAAAASHKMGFVGDRVTVHMHGGELLVEFAADGRIDMTGPVVYIGSITLAEQFFA
ncbi:MAG: diaminopimelate epimerase [Roseburia hominis]|uniref:diaminopimelate epimerase n=1 Tax=Roseburia hominis TaxID=301301 RepID=UPI0026EA2D79|nr:diaminopimelate epimerase [Roseburia hominis]MCI7521962.1 diaminopimelate epimerase [Roseburia hominis]MDD6242137.1 diaminopimelate epimerase [Roseburia hominis]